MQQGVAFELNIQNGASSACFDFQTKLKKKVGRTGSSTMIIHLHDYCMVLNTMYNQFYVEHMF